MFNNVEELQVNGGKGGEAMEEDAETRVCIAMGIVHGHLCRASA